MPYTVGHRAHAALSAEAYRADTSPTICRHAAPLPEAQKHQLQLAALADLASVDIETSMAADLSGSLHSLFDDVCDKTLPIYFGPLLGRLYLEGL